MNIFKNGVGRPSNNIKRARAIIAVIAVILSATIGYALFSQTVTVKGTATASGTFQITPTCYTTQLSSLSDSYDRLLSEGETIGGTSNDTCTVVDNSHVTYSTNLLYPGALNVVTLKFKNTGTIPAVMYFDDLTEENEYCITEGGTESCNSSYNYFTIGNIETNIMIIDYQYGGYEDANGNIFPLDDSEEGENVEKYLSLIVSNGDKEGFKLEPNESFYLLLVNGWNKDYGTSGETSLNLKTNITYEFPFEQYNE